MNKSVKGIISLIFVIGLLYFLFGGGIEKQAANEMQKLENQVALDSERQYEIAKNSGNGMDSYVHAGLVAAAYLQAEDEVNYKKWKEIEKQEAKNIGMPTE
jgi:hypothetical protein